MVALHLAEYMCIKSPGLGDVRKFRVAHSHHVVVHVHESYLQDHDPQSIIHDVLEACSINL